MYLKFFVFCVLFSDVFCQYTYQLPDGDTNKSLNIIAESASMFEIKIECYDYDSLKFFEMRLGPSGDIALYNGVLLEFVRCFNNKTDNENYNYGLRRWFNSLPYFTSGNNNGYPFTVRHHEYAEVNSDVLFNDFDFRKFKDVTFENLGFISTKFFKHLYCTVCKFINNGRIDFNDFRENITDTYRLEISFNKLINFSRDNVKKWIGLGTLVLSDFDLDDYNTFNVPDLFQFNVKISDVKIEKSKNKITLHEHVFRGFDSLYSISLQKLQLDHIPKDLFKDLKNLVRVVLSYNNIKTIDPATFQTNEKLSFISFNDNPFFTEPHNKLEGFDVGGSHVHLKLGNFTIHTFDLLELLIKNTKVDAVVFQSFLIDKFNVSDFTRVFRDRGDRLLRIAFKDGETALDLEQIKSFGNIIRPYYDIINSDLSVIISIQFSADSLCHDCNMVKNLFPHFLKHYQDSPGFYFEDWRLFISLQIPDSCRHLEENFEKSFDENCPTDCNCKFNPLVDKVKINCNNQNLTKLPLIPYPVQFEKIESIELNFENNSIGVLGSVHQDPNVLKKVSVLNLKNNKIESLEEEADLLRHIRELNICDNPIISTPEQHILLRIAAYTTVFTKSSCFDYNKNSRTGLYIRENKFDVIDKHLNSLQCN